MPKIVSFSNQKGGVGKSATSIQFAYYLALKLNKKVLVIDFDPQGNTSSRIGGFGSVFGQSEYNGATRSAELFSGEDIDITVFKCPVGGIDLIHTPKDCPDLSDIEKESLDIAVRPRNHISKIKDNYDYIIIDCPPSLGRKLFAALSLSTHVVAPVKLSGFAIDGIGGLMKTISMIQKNYNPSLKIAGVLVNDMDKSKAHEAEYQRLKNEIPEQFLFANKIMHRPPLDKATGDGTPIWLSKYGHVASKEVLAVMNEIVEKVG